MSLVSRRDDWPITSVIEPVKFLIEARSIFNPSGVRCVYRTPEGHSVRFANQPCG